ncbi:MAG: DNA ligase [Pseudomonadales bacterium]|nr:DNA ligase [Pseudomonadales bacterium]
MPPSYFQSFLSLSLLFYTSLNVSADNIQLQLATVCNLDTIEHIENYYVSEKYDGVRAYWNGTQLISRSQHTYKAPAWFTASLPPFALDGELWLGRQQFDDLSAIVRKETPPADWHSIRFQVFDLPTSSIDFEQRLTTLRSLFQKQRFDRHIQLIPQQIFSSKESLQQHLLQITASGAEGLMLHHKKGRYKAGRNSALCKLKIHNDDEANVIGYSEGKGKYKGLLGALIVTTNAGLTFKIGTGFTDQQRKSPPAIGSTVTYRYNGLTKTGLPRFARFIRIRQEN